MIIKKALLPGFLAASLLASALFATTVAAQSPPIPPARFAGSVTLNGTPAPAGTPIEARVGTAVCGTTTVFIEGGASRYVVDVAANDAEHPGCGTPGISVSFFVSGQAAGSGEWVNFDLNQLNLVATASTPTATPSATPTGTAPAPAPATGTPRAPTTGSGMASDGDGLAWGLGAGAVLLAVISVAAAITASRLSNRR